MDKELLEQLQGGNRFQKRFLEQRKVFFWGPVHDESAKKVVDQLLFLDTEKPGEEIKLYINSPGGVVTSGMVVMDTMQMIASPVRTICMGMCASMGALMLSHGDKGRREIYPHGRVMIHQPSIGGIQGQATDIEITANEIQKTKILSAEILANNCGKSVEKILEDFDRDYWMNADEAIAYGIVDTVSESV